MTTPPTPWASNSRHCNRLKYTMKTMVTRSNIRLKRSLPLPGNKTHTKCRGHQQRPVYSRDTLTDSFFAFLMKIRHFVRCIIVNRCVHMYECTNHYVCICICVCVCDVYTVNDDTVWIRIEIESVRYRNTHNVFYTCMSCTLLVLQRWWGRRRCRRRRRWPRRQWIVFRGYLDIYYRSIGSSYPLYTFLFLGLHSILF